MIEVSLTKSGGKILEFESRGHAGAGEYGQDIVCSAVSALLITTANALEKLTREFPEEEQNPDGGYLKVTIKGEDPDGQILMKAMELGLRQIAESYPENLRIREC